MDSSQGKRFGCRRVVAVGSRFVHVKTRGGSRAETVGKATKPDIFGRVITLLAVSAGSRTSSGRLRG
ncbi:hypothetical protein EVAR_54582_1 [Eumeta japonica]|uniref:Uncharacterized protein n=1 Tax=Eumeta variegata TaxID=151549 RepID=A0A4C1YJR3_EUMVA|nr:hypothetical protein EVAR_54582_1 [Eumeta japonica]